MVGHIRGRARMAVLGIHKQMTPKLSGHKNLRGADRPSWGAGKVWAGFQVFAGFSPSHVPSPGVEIPPFFLLSFFFLPFQGSREAYFKLRALKILSTWNETSVSKKRHKNRTASPHCSEEEAYENHPMLGYGWPFHVQRSWPILPRN